MTLFNTVCRLGGMLLPQLTGNALSLLVRTYFSSCIRLVYRLTLRKKVRQFSILHFAHTLAEQLSMNSIPSRFAKFQLTSTHLTPLGWTGCANYPKYPCTLIDYLTRLAHAFPMVASKRYCRLQE